MKLDADQLQALLDLGMTVEQITAAMRVLSRDAERDERDAKRKAADRAKAYRDRKRDAERDGHHVAVTSDAPSRTHVVSTSLPSEEVKNPPDTSCQTPKGANAKRGTRLPDDWRPGEESLEFGFQLLGRRVDTELPKFRDHWRSAPGAKGLKLDWDATWRNWCRRAAEGSPQQPRAGPPPRTDFWARVRNGTRDLENGQGPQHANGHNGHRPGSVDPRTVADRREDPQRGPTIDVEPLGNRGGTGAFGR